MQVFANWINHIEPVYHVIEAHLAPWQEPAMRVMTVVTALMLIGSFFLARMVVMHQRKTEDDAIRHLRSRFEAYAGQIDLLVCDFSDSHLIQAQAAHLRASMCLVRDLLDDAQERAAKLP